MFAFAIIGTVEVKEGVLLVAKPELNYKKRYKQKIEELINCYDRFNIAGEEVFLASGMIFSFDLEPLEKLTLFAMAKRMYRANDGRSTYKDLAADVGCSEERIIEALHQINERLESGDIYRNIPLH